MLGTVHGVQPINKNAGDTNQEKYNTMAFELAKFFINANLSKYKLPNDYDQVCKDFYEKYHEALKVLSELDGK